ncbi:MAG: hypothetical protein HQ573_04070 [Desulfobacteraceae bacterium]|nr:hypothetical protein [Desulfobacteraceae bacterium]
MKAYSIAKTEISALKGLYNSSLYSFSQVEEFLRYKAYCKNYRPDGCIDKDLNVVHPIHYKLKALFRNRLRQQLRELIFIRIVSVLETYLVDTLRDIFVITKRPFRDQTSQIGFTKAELLSAPSISYIFSKIINKECRRLTSGGFIEIIKYYRSRFDIDLTSIPPGKSIMNEYHERRHLLVHRLGKPDSLYRRVYGFKSKKLSVDEDYLNKSFDDFESFIHSVQEKINDLIDKIDDSKSLGVVQPSITYRILKIIDNEPSIFQNDFQFWVNDELFLFRDILRETKYLNDQIFEVLLSGDEEALRTYAKYVRRVEKKGYIVATVLKTSGLYKTRIGKLDEELINRVKDALPEQPWSKNIHKQLATNLGTSNKKVSSAIQILIQRGIFKNQYNGIVLNN